MLWKNAGAYKRRGRPGSGCGLQSGNKKSGSVTDHFQKAYSENGFYAPTENVDWTPGFWTGEIWLAYEHTGNEALKKAGELQMASFLKRINEKQDVETHDLGFMYSPSCVAGYKLTGSRVDGKPL